MLVSFKHGKKEGVWEEYEDDGRLYRKGSYTDGKEEGVWEFSGGGFGHGAGLSQAGAFDLALRGWTARKILKYYYPGTTYESFK